MQTSRPRVGIRAMVGESLDSAPVPPVERQVPRADDRRAYWEDRLGREFTLDGVGYAGLGTPFNAQMYRVRRHCFLKALRPALTASPPVDVLDVGSGTGFYIERWHELGARCIVGADMTQTAVDELARRYPGQRFVRLDIGATEIDLEPAAFDYVSAMDVLFHIVDDHAHARAISNLARLARPGGRVVLSENLYRQAPPPTAHQVGRSEATILGRLEAAGLVVEQRAPMFVLMNNPVRSRSRLHHVAWSRLAATVAGHPRLSGPVGRALYPLEVALVDRVRRAPSTELLVCRRASTPA
jgi:SAM-dependent methyltransferase